MHFVITLSTHFFRLPLDTKFGVPLASNFYTFLRGQPKAMTDEESGKRPVTDHSLNSDEGYYLYADSALTADGLSTQVTELLLFRT